MPQYGVLVFTPAPADPMDLTPDYLESLDRYPAQVEELGGRIVTGFAFEPSTTAFSIRGDRIESGTLLKSPDVVAGFFVLDAPDLDTALRIARLNPATREGGVEIRPLFVAPTQ